MNSHQLATVMRMLAGTATVAAIVRETKITRQTIYRTLRALEAQRVARICRWNCDSSGRATEPVWGLGGEPSDQRRRMTVAEKQKRYRSRRQKAGAK